MARVVHLVVGSVVATWVVAIGSIAGAQPVPEPQPFLSGLAFPTNLAFTPDGRLLFTEKETGNVRVVTRGGDLLPAPFATFAVSAAAETGMLGIAVHPSFDEEPWVYLYFSDAASGRNVLVRVRAEGDVGGARDDLAVLLPTSTGYHNGGDLAFGTDGMLYVAVGEGHEPARAQITTDPGGKVLRLAPDGTAAPGNPFGRDNPVYSLGHRNSFGLCVDPATGLVWETENGPDVDDEVNVLRAGGNFGWPEVTGDSGGRFDDPVAVFPTPEALTGCAAWQGELWFGAANTGALYRMALDPGGATPQLAAELGAPVTDVASGVDGDLYVATADAIWRLEGEGSPRPTRTGAVTPDPIGTAEPTDTPDAPGDGGSVPAAVPIAAGILLVAGLTARVIAGRRSRRSLG